MIVSTLILSQYFFQFNRFFPVEKCGVTSHCLYRYLLISTLSLTCRTNQTTGFYMAGTSVMRELRMINIWIFIGSWFWNPLLRGSKISKIFRVIQIVSGSSSMLIHQRLTLTGLRDISGQSWLQNQFHWIFDSQKLLIRWYWGPQACVLKDFLQVLLKCFYLIWSVFLAWKY